MTVAIRPPITVRSKTWASFAATSEVETIVHNTVFGASGNGKLNLHGFMLSTSIPSADASWLITVKHGTTTKFVIATRDDSAVPFQLDFKLPADTYFEGTVGEDLSITVQNVGAGTYAGSVTLNVFYSAASVSTT